MELSVNQDNTLSITNEAGVAIPIANHPADGDLSSDPIDLDAITAKQIRINLGDGDDTVLTPLLSNFDVTVSDSLGDDFTLLESTTSTTPADGSLRVFSETIEISSQGSAFRLGGIETRLVGDVQVSDPFLVNQIQVDSLLRVDGTLTLGNDLVIRGNGSLNLSGATLSASDSPADLFIGLPSGDVRLGEVNDSAGKRNRQSCCQLGI